MKVAMIFGKGLDGCGVQRGGVEMARWAKRSGVQFDMYSMEERTFARGGFHGGEYIKMQPHELRDYAVRINETYDIVIYNSYPSAKNSDTAVWTFYEDFVKVIEKPISVAMMHEISKQQIDRIPMLFLILNRVDIVYNFSEKTWFATNVTKYLPKKLGERVKRFRLWTSFPELEAKRKAGLAVPKKRRLMYMGRWSTMKDPRRVLELASVFEEREPSFECLLIGIEKSIGAKYDILDHPRTDFSQYPKDEWVVPQGKTKVFGPYKHEWGMARMSETMFGASFYSLPKAPENHGDRMEYTQIETIAVGAIPVFDKIFGENNHTENGTPYIEVPDLAVWSNRYDLEETADKILEVANSEALQSRYRDASFQFIKENFDGDIVLPAFFEEIMKIGKDPDKLDDLALMERIYGSDKAAREASRMFVGTKFPISFIEAETRSIYKFVGKMHKRELVQNSMTKPSLEAFF